MSAQLEEEPKTESGTIFRVLSGVEARPIDPDKIPFPDDSVVLYAFEGERIVGRTSIIHLPHIEGTWVAEDKRGTTLAFRLVKKIEEIIRDDGKGFAFAYAWDQQPEVSDYLQRVGYQRFPVTVFFKQVEEVK
jgi:GNAT superfamily N-acetyltransferase